MVFCCKCGFENDENDEKCVSCGEFLIKDEFFNVKKYENLEEIFTDENFDKLSNLTHDAYNTIISNIIELGHFNLNTYWQNNPKKHLTTLEKIIALASSYSKISYKSSGAELGSYSFNSIRVDDRLDDANQISTLIHELSHHLYSEIFEQILMYQWECEKSNVIEAFAWFTLIGSPLTQLSNEYCAHTSEGRFIPHGYQNYGSFNAILTEEFDPEKDEHTINLGLIMGNTMAQDIIHILEEFIDYDLRNEIKLQFKKDFTFPPKYDQILLESNVTLPDDEKLLSIISILKSGFEAAKDKQMHEILDNFTNNFTEVNKA